MSVANSDRRGFLSRLGMIIIVAGDAIKLSFTVAAPISLSNPLRKSEAVSYAVYEFL